MSNSPILFVSKYQQWQHLLDRAPELTRSATVVTSDLQVAHERARTGESAVELWDFFGGDDQAELIDAAYTLAAQWFLPYLASIRHDGLALAELMQFDLTIPFAHCMSVERAFGRLVQEHPCRELILFEELNRTLYGGAGENDLAEAALLGLAEDSHIPVRLLRMPDPNRAPRRPRPMPRALNGKHRRISTNGHVNGDDRRPIILTLAGEPDLSSQEPLRAALRTRGYRTVAATLSSHPAPDPAADLLSFDAFKNIPFDLSALEQHVEDAWQRFQKARNSHTGLGASLLRNHHLDFQFRLFFDHLVEGARCYEATGALADLYQPRACLVGCDVYGVRRCVVKALAARGVPTIQPQHGWAPNCDFRAYDFVSDYLLVPGLLDRQGHLACGRSPERVLITGAPIFPEVPAVKPQTPTPNRARRLLVITALLPQSFGVPYANPGIHRRAWENLVQWAKRQANVQIIVKPHPRFDHLEYYRRLNEEHGGVLQVLNGSVPLTEVLPDADAVLVMNSPTTGMIEAICQHKPIVHCLNAVYRLDPGLDPYVQSGALQVCNLNELPSALEQILTQPERRQSVLAAQDAFLQRTITYKGEEALKRSADLVDEVAQSAAPKQPRSNSRIARIVHAFIHEGQATKFRQELRRARQESPFKDWNRTQFARHVIAWGNAWARQFGSSLRRADAALEVLNHVAAVVPLSQQEQRRLAATVRRSDAYRCRAQGDLRGLCRNGIPAVLEPVVLRENLDLCRILVESLAGPIPTPLLNTCKRLLGRQDSRERQGK